MKGRRKGKGESGESKVVHGGAIVVTDKSESVCHAHDCAIMRRSEKHTQRERAWFFHLIAKALYSCGDYKSAIKHLEHACELAPDDAFYHFELGELYLKMQRLEEAAMQFEAALLCAPLDDYYHVRFAAVCVRLGKLRKAAEVMERAAKLRPRNAFYRYLLVKIYENLSEPKLAEPHRKFVSELDNYDLNCIKLFQTDWMGYK
ncbi:MAG: tetratricopeptide repeat protein [Armatimonadota bacterium]|nr:tetratricopeptide repeat protein [Armatimonadota bacterium]MCX7776951.1 tetratricopeptide repeat protein [Armatimonadota bacterium]MDW8024785.1 tetratricopeptide repeat protein [Armatimonadota bacterium]